MKLTDLTAHRTYPLPEGPWVMSQTWENLLFAHWPVSTEIIRPLIPSGLQVDTFDGHAWLGIVPFEMTHIHARGLPPIPGTSEFPELNVRTYVTRDDKPGVYFFSLDAAHRLAVAAARRFFHLPYFNAEMKVITPNDTTRYTSRRTHRRAQPADFIGQYRPTSEIFHSHPDNLDHWLTARFCLYTNDRKGRNVSRRHPPRAMAASASQGRNPHEHHGIGSGHPFARCQCHSTYPSFLQKA